MEKLKGTVEHIIFHNKKNGYTVADFDIEGQMMTVVGIFEELKEGEFLSMTGFYKEHSVYGEQFQMESYAMALPTSRDGIIRYLGSGMLPGIGEKTATEIVERFGERTLDILDNEPNRLLEVKGIGKKTLSKFLEVYIAQKEIREVLIELQEYGISSTYAIKLYKTYRQHTVAILLEDPYRMITDIKGIGFKTADKIAYQLGVDKESPKRILAGITYCLSLCYLNGNTFMREDELVGLSSRILEVSEDEVQLQLENLTISGEIKLEYFEDKPAYYPIDLFMAEDNAALTMARLTEMDLDKKIENIYEKIAEYEKFNRIVLDVLQRDAIECVLQNTLAIITGGPGTGKTTIINGIVHIFDKLGLKTVLAAPTGRAAKRMTETSGKAATTIHRLLEYEYSDEENFPSFKRNEDNLIEADAIILDEASMIDIVLMNSLLIAVRPGTRVVMVGDADQLPSVGPGNVLKDLIESNIVKVVRLKQIFRQSEKSMISYNAHQINCGEVPQIDNESDFMLIRKSDPDRLLDTILELVEWRLSEKKMIDTFKEVQIISPLKKGKLGVINLNKELQQVLNPPSAEKKEFEYGLITYREGDKIMQRKNNYRIKWEDQANGDRGEGIYNGDIGTILEIDSGKKLFKVLLNDDKLIDYEFDWLEDITHAYAMTVHKSQGSEFPVVIMPLVGGPPGFLNRKLLYTAVTRAKKLLILMGPQYNLMRMVKSSSSSERKTAFKERILMYKELKL